MNDNSTDQLNSIMHMRAISDYIERLGPGPKNSDCLFPHQMFSGIKIVEVPVRMKPKIQIKEDSANFCSPEFRNKMNVWLLKRFGSRDISTIQPGMAFMMGDAVLMRPESAVMLRSCI